MAGSIEIRRGIAVAVASLVAACAADPAATGASGAVSEVWDETTSLGPDGKADGDRESSPAYDQLPAGARMDDRLQVLFAPIDPVVSLEVEWIDRVRTARRADPASYEEGHNPYR